MFDFVSLFFLFVLADFINTRQRVVRRQQYQSQMIWDCYSHGKQIFILLQYFVQDSNISSICLQRSNVFIGSIDEFLVKSRCDAYKDV
jgi:hypothetical protein